MPAKFRTPSVSSDEVPGLFDQAVVLIDKEMAVGDDVAGEELAVAFGALAFLDFGHALHRHENLKDVITHLLSQYGGACCHGPSVQGRSGRG